MAFFSDYFSGFWKSNKEDKEKELANNSTVSAEEDGAINIQGLHSFSSYSFETDFKNYTAQVESYRKISEIADVESAVTEIVNEAINFEDDDSSPVEISLDETEFSENIRKKIVEEYQYILKIMNFSLEGFEQFREWYVDGCSYYHKIVDPDKPKVGLIGVKKLDSSKSRKVREYEKDTTTGLVKNVNEFFVYDEKAGINKKVRDYNEFDDVIKFPKEAISYCDSGKYDPVYGFPRSHIHKAIRPVNNLVSVETSSVIYRLINSSEKRLFYVDVGQSTNKKGMAYVQQLMQSYNNNISYDSETGETNSGFNIRALVENIWIPRKNGKNTEVQTLPAGQNLGEMSDVEYFLKKLYKSLNVPTGRIENNALVNIGGQLGELDREELKFNKFIKRLRKRFNMIFLDLLQTQLLLKEIITPQEWVINKDVIKFIYNQDLYISEQKEKTVLRDRIDLANEIDPYIGKYISHDTVRRKIFKQNDDDIIDEDKLIEEEKKDPRYSIIEDEEEKEEEFSDENELNQKDINIDNDNE